MSISNLSDVLEAPQFEIKKEFRIYYVDGLKFLLKKVQNHPKLAIGANEIQNCFSIIENNKHFVNLDQSVVVTFTLGKYLFVFDSIVNDWLQGGSDDKEIRYALQYRKHLQYLAFEMSNFQMDHIYKRLMSDS